MTSLVGFGVVLAIGVVAVVIIAMAVMGRKRQASRSDATYTDDPTGYVPGVWLLGGAESAAPGQQSHARHAQHGVDAGGAHAADAGGAGDAGGVDGEGVGH